MGVRRVALGGDILGSRRNPRTITTTITTEAPAPATTRPYITPTTKPTATAAATATATNYEMRWADERSWADKMNK